jgi:regulator of sigma E protease
MLVIIIIVLLFASLVILHELGHFIVAKRNGVGAEEFGIGFPPMIWGKKVRGTLYSINWIPLGGFVRLKGEDSADIGPHTFGAAKFSKQAKILLAGVGMNLVTAVVILYGLCLVGIPALGASFQPNFLHPTYTQPKQLLLADVEAGSPAAKAGLKKGDYVLKANGKLMVTDTDLSSFTKDHAGETVDFVVRSNGVTKTLAVKLRPPSTQDGYLGVASQQVYKLRYDPFSSIIAAFYITGALFIATIVGVIELIISIPALIMGLFSSTVPAAAQNASGPLGIIFILKSISSLGFSYIFVFMANIAVALAAFNVLPLPALDGGRLALIAWQKATKKHLSADSEAKIHAVGFMALIALMCVITVYDLRKYF